MKHSKKFGSGKLSKSIFVYSMLCLPMAGMAIFTPGASAQQLTGTLTGTAYDQSGAAVPHASVVLKNQASGDIRSAVTDGAGHFAITSVQPGSYKITITAKGFSGFEENDITMNQGDSREVPNIKLNVGGNSNTVNVVAGADAVVPTDTAEISTSLNEQMINDFPLQGRDAGELLKIMPGMGLNNGINQGSSFNDKVVGSNNGPVGAYSSNGTQPNGSMAFMLDGANLVDPGNFGTQIANINQDMVANVKVLMSNYGAEYAKGPVIFQAFSKSGGQQFHGEGYLYTHNAALNSVDAYTKSQGGSNKNESYYYMGGNIGGPVILPFVKFNHDRNKLFFWFGYEYMKQQPAGTPANFNTPTPAQLGGDFSNAGVDPNALTTWPGFYSQLTNNLPAGATATALPTGDFDPNIKGILKLYPKPNLTPNATNGYNNFQYINQEPVNRWEATGKADYAFSDNTKLTGSYAYQKENDIQPISVWWSAPWTLPTPSPSVSKTVTYIVLTNFTHVFNPTTTNEAVFTWSHFVNPYSLTDPSADSRTTNGFNVPGLFGYTSNQIPNFEGPWGGTLANLSSYPFNPTFGGIKEVPAAYDNFTKLIGDHTIKAGFYWDDSRNSQNSNASDNGTYNFGGNQFSTNNYVADVELGRVASYSQQNQDVPNNTHFHQVAGYVQDSWRAGKRLTLNYGLRFDHIGQWDGIGSGQPGFQVFSLAAYDNGPNPAPDTGLLWHAKNSNIPLSGFKTPPFYLAPRLGLAYDIFGTGKTVFRGGFAVYRYQATSETASAQNGPFGSFGYGTPTAFEGYANVTKFSTPVGPANQTGPNNNVSAMQLGDDRAPYTNDWNATVSQALPYRSVVELSYVGNRSANEYMDGSNSNLYNQNNAPKGAFFRPDPKTGKLVSPGSPGCSGDVSLYCQDNPTAYATSFNANDYRPLSNYANVYLLTHAPYSNYNSFQASYAKQSGPVTFTTNYTFSKVLGIRDGGSNNGPGNGTAVDPFTLRNNYGPLAYDHTHIINLTYNWRLPKPIHGDGLANHLAAGAVNGWQLSGYTAYQSGAPLQPGLGGGFNTTYVSGSLTVPTIGHPNLPDNSIALPNGLRTVGVGASQWFGTSAYNVLVPALTCDPRKGLKKGQQFNPACFTTPAYGTDGPYVLPYLRAPSYFDSDLGIYKSFAVREGQRVEFRVSAQNFLNHPLRQFGLANQGDESLNFTGTSNATCTGCVDANGKPLQITSLSPTNTNATTTGIPAFKNGSRFLTVAAKYYF